MNLKTLNIFRILLAIVCIAIGIDKFFNFLSICSLMGNMSDKMAIGIGVLEIILGLFIFFKVQLISTLYFTAFFMGTGVFAHLVNDTYDIGGALLLMFYALSLVYFEKNLSKRET